MSLFMDVHSIEGGVSASDVAGAHMKDLETQQKYGVSYLRYWVNEEEERSSVWSRRTTLTTPTQSIGRPTGW